MRGRLHRLAFLLAALTLGLTAPRSAHAAELQMTFDRTGAPARASWRFQPMRHRTTRRDHANA